MKKKIKRFLELSFYLAKSGFKLRNEGSYLGILWYILNPILFFGLLFFIFSQNLGSEIKNYPLYLFVGIIIFNFFQSATSESTELIRNNRHIFKSINFPRSAFVGGSVLKFLYSHIFEFIVLVFFMIYLGVNISNIFFYPLILVFITLFIFGVSLLLSALSVFFVDIKNIWAFASKLIWFGTPIFYEIEKGTFLFKINLLNPLYYFIKVSREIIIYQKIPETWMICGIIIFSVSFLLLGVFVFEKLNHKFMERI